MALAAPTVDSDAVARLGTVLSDPPSRAILVRLAAAPLRADGTKPAGRVS